MRTILFGAFVIFAVTLFGCGGKSPLTEGQKERFKETVSSVGSAAVAVKQAGTRGGFQPVDAMNFVNKGLGILDEDKRRTAQMSKVISEKMNEGVCEVTVSLPSMPEMDEDFSGELTKPPGFGSFPGFKKESQQEMRMSMLVEGKGCPVLMELEASIAMTPKAVKGNFLWTLEVQDEEYRQLNDIDRLAISGSIDGKMNFSQTEMSAEAKVDIEGSIHSQKNGDIEFYFNGEMDSRANQSSSKTEVEAAFGFVYSDFEAELKVQMKQTDDLNDETNYFINDVEVDETEFNEFWKASSIEEFKPKSGPQKSESHPEPVVPVTPEF